MSSVDIPEEARQKYIERRQTDLETCKKALSQKDYDAIARVGHQVKGNAVTFGYDALGAIAIDLEACALKKDPAGLEKAIGRFAQFLKKK